MVVRLRCDDCEDLNTLARKPAAGQALSPRPIGPAHSLLGPTDASNAIAITTPAKGSRACLQTGGRLGFGIGSYSHTILPPRRQTLYGAPWHRISWP